MDSLLNSSNSDQSENVLDHPIDCNFYSTGINLTTESQGIFPSVYATDLEFYDVNNDTTVKQPTHKQYKLHFLGSMEVNHHKGSDVLVDAIEKVRYSKITDKT